MPILRGLPGILAFNLTWSKNGSSVETNNIGDSGHPFLVPIHICNGLEVIPFALTSAGGNNKELLSKGSLRGNPMCSNVDCKKSQVTLSKAFSASVDNSSMGIDLAFAWWMRLRVHIVQSLASLPGIKSVWSKCINVGRKFLILFANGLANLFKS